MTNSCIKVDTGSKLQAFWMAIRPRTLTAATIPVFVGVLLARTTTPIQWDIALYTWLFALLIQIGTNLTNDALDFNNGADTEARLGPPRATQSGLLLPYQVLAGAVVSFLAALLIGIPLVIQGGWMIGLLLLISVVAGYCYTGGPYPLAYHGLGDLFVFLFFGLIGTMASYYLQTGHLTIESAVAGIQIGLLATVMIAINNLRDHVGDAKANKRTLAVRYGVLLSRSEISALLLLPFFGTLFWFSNQKDLAALLPLLTLPLAIGIMRSIWKVEPGVAYNQFLCRAAGLHLLFGILLGIGIGFGK